MKAETKRRSQARPEIRQYKIHKRTINTTSQQSKFKNFSQYICQDVRQVLNIKFRIGKRDSLPPQNRKVDLPTYIYFFSKYRSEENIAASNGIKDRKQSVNLSRLKFFLLYSKYPTILDNSDKYKCTYRQMFNNFVGKQVTERQFKALSFKMKVFLLREECKEMLFAIIKKKTRTKQFEDLYKKYVEDFLSYLQKGGFPYQIRSEKQENNCQIKQQ